MLLRIRCRRYTFLVNTFIADSFLQLTSGESDSATAQRRRSAAAASAATAARSAPPAPTVVVPELPRHEEMTYAEFVQCSSEEGEPQLECDTCSICLEQFEPDTNVKKLPCGHVFHPICVDIWFEVSSRCPLCRSDARTGDCEGSEPQRPAAVVRTPRNVEYVVRGRVTTMMFVATLNPDVRFGVTIASTANGLLVTYVEPDGAGEQQGVEVGDYLIKQDDELVPRNLSDAVFVARLIALARAVDLGFARQVDDQTHEQAESL